VRRVVGVRFSASRLDLGWGGHDWGEASSRLISGISLVQALAVVCTLTIAAVGCSGGSREPVGQVGGLVSIGGKPVNGGQIMFVPTSIGPTATGVIGPDGRYTLTTFKPGDGAVLGAHEVLIESMPVVDAVLPEALLSGKPPTAPKAEIPVKYGIPRKSGLSATVTSGSNAIDFALE